MNARRTVRLAVGALVAAVTLWSASGCVSHISPYSPKRRPVPEGPWNELEPEERPTGALWNEGGMGNFLFTDRRAFQRGDVLTIVVSEEAKALRSAGTELGKDSDISASAGALFGFLKALQDANPNFDQTAMIGTSLKNDFKGQGQTMRNDKLEATITAVVQQVLRNGNLYIEGRKAILVNDEEHHLYVSGIVRPEDVQRDNSVLSSRLADMQIEFVGRGVLTDKNRPGWFARVLDFIWPF